MVQRPTTVTRRAVRGARGWRGARVPRVPRAPRSPLRRARAGLRGEARGNGCKEAAAVHVLFLRGRVRRPDRNPAPLSLRDLGTPRAGARPVGAQATRGRGGQGGVEGRAFTRASGATRPRDGGFMRVAARGAARPSSGAPDGDCPIANGTFSPSPAMPGTILPRASICPRGRIWRPRSSRIASPAAKDIAAARRIAQRLNGGRHRRPALRLHRAGPFGGGVPQHLVLLERGRPGPRGRGAGRARHGARASDRAFAGRRPRC